MPTRSARYSKPKQDGRIWDNCPGRVRDVAPGEERRLLFYPPCAWGKVSIWSAREHKEVRAWTTIRSSA